MTARFVNFTGPALALILLTGCGGQPPALVSKAEARAELLAADRAFAALTRESGVAAAYQRYLVDDALQLPDGGVELAGKPEILGNARAATADESFLLNWEPQDAVVSGAGDLGYTWGYYSLEVASPGGEQWFYEGKYVYVWRHTEADGWRVILDISNQNEPPFPDELDFEFLPDDPAGTEG